MVTDDANNLYSTGPLASALFFDTENTIDFFGGTYDAFVTKHDQDGNLIWTNSFGTSSRDDVRGLVADNNGNVFLTIQTQQEGTIDMAPNETFADNRDLLSIPTLGPDDATFLIKYNSDGTFAWGFPLETLADARGGLTIDNNGDVYLASYFTDSIKPDPLNDPTLRYDADNALPQGAPARPGFVAKYNGDNGHLMWFLPTNSSTYSYSAGGGFTGFTPGHVYPNSVHFDENTNSIYVFGDYNTEYQAQSNNTSDSIFGLPNPPTTAFLAYFLWQIGTDGTPMRIASFDHVFVVGGAPKNRLASSSILTDGSDVYVRFNGNTRLLLAAGDTLDVIEAGASVNNSALLKIDANDLSNVKQAVAFNSEGESTFTGMDLYGDYLFITARTSFPATYEHPTAPFTVETANLSAPGDPELYRLDGFIWQLNKSDLALVDSFRTEGIGDESFFDIHVKSPTEVFAATLFKDSLRFEGIDTVLGFNPSTQFWDAAWTRFSFPNVMTIGRPETAVSTPKFGLYPNPVGESVTLTFEASEATVRLFDPKGQLLQTRAIRSGEQLDVGDLPAGLYLLELQTEHDRHSQRLLKH